MSQLIFIYAADKGLIPDIKGAAQKLLKGKSNCSLCSITYNVVSEKDTWKQFINSIDPTPIFYHSNDIPKDILAFLAERQIKLPVVLKKLDSSYDTIITAKDMDAMDNNPNQLIEQIKLRL
jgi:hypothetical protein